MKRILCCLSMVALSLASTAEGQQSGERVEGIRPPSHIYAPPKTEDHMAIRVVTPAAGPRHPEQVTVIRSGPWQREDVRREGVTSTKFADFERGVSVTWVFRDDGTEYLSASQAAPGVQGPFIRERTGETQRWAGETCEVWAWRLAEPDSRRLNTLTCVTHDGIELWQGYVGYDGTVKEMFHVMIVQRRDVRPEEARLPPSAVDWRRWSVDATPGDTASGYEVTLSGIHLGGDAEITDRRRGDWSVSEAHYSPSERSLTLSHPRASLHFRDDERGRNLTLQRRSSAPESFGGGGVAYTPPRESTILGRRCVWYDTMPDVADAGGSECRDAEGIVLARGATGWGTGLLLSVQATRFSASPATKEAITPSREAFSWIAG